MKPSALLSLLLISILCSCSNETEDVLTASVFPKEITFTRTTSESQSLPPGSKALFNADGALPMENVVLTYSGSRWEGDGLPEWNDEEEISHLTVLYPVYNNLEYNTGNLYQETLLEDVLVVRDTLTQAGNVHLQFDHLFSRLTIQVSESIQEQLEEIRLNCPLTVTGLHPTEEEITSTATQEHTQVLEFDESGQYSFIFPPMTTGILTLTVVTTDGEYTPQLPTYTYESGVEYICNLREKRGIQSAEELIIFSKLINGKKVSGRSLDEFYNVIDGDTVILLDKDIPLTPDDCKELLPIGYHSSKGFNHTFDGQGHTISGLVIPDKTVNSDVKDGFSGLFGFITTDGIVKNLTISNAQNTKNASTDAVGVLAAQNYGLIIDCSIFESTLTAQNTSGREYHLGFICGNSYGRIINCHVRNCTLEADYYCHAGFIVGRASGKIFNCRSYNNTYSYKNKTDLYAGGIAGSSRTETSLSVVNCYIYTIASKNRDHFGSVIGLTQKGLVRNVFYNKGDAYYKKTTNTDFFNTGAVTQSDGFIYNDTIITDHFHNWIDTKGKANYPDITFKRWKIPEGKYPIFDE